MRAPWRPQRQPADSDQTGLSVASESTSDFSHIQSVQGLEESAINCRVTPSDVNSGVTPSDINCWVTPSVNSGLAPPSDSVSSAPPQQDPETVKSSAVNGLQILKN